MNDINGSIPNQSINGNIGVGVLTIDGGASDYNQLTNKPSINDIPLVGNKTTEDLGLFNGDYEDLKNKPTIPTKTSDLTNDSNFISSIPSEYVTESKLNTAISGKANSEDIPTKTSELTNDSGFLTQHQDISNKQDTLVSGTNIKTINNQSILGEGNITIDGGTGGNNVTVDSELSTTSENPVQNKVIAEALNNKANSEDIPTKVSDLKNDSGFLTQHQDISNKQDVLISGTNIKTINNLSLLGSGNIDLASGSGSSGSGESGYTYTNHGNGFETYKYDEGLLISIYSATADITHTIQSGDGSAIFFSAIHQIPDFPIEYTLLSYYSCKDASFVMHNVFLQTKPTLTNGGSIRSWGTKKDSGITYTRECGVLYVGRWK